MRRDRSTALGRVDAFIQNGDRFSRDDCRAWLPEILELRAILYDLQQRQNIMGIYTRPDPKISERIIALNVLVSRAGVIGIQRREGELELHEVDWA